MVFDEIFFCVIVCFLKKVFKIFNFFILFLEKLDILDVFFEEYIIIWEEILLKVKIVIEYVFFEFVGMLVKNDMYLFK